MMDPGSIDTPLAGLAAGLVTSLHCVGMCGPLACSVLPARSSGHAAAQIPIALYHGSRMMSYTIIGALAGAIGSTLAFVFTSSITRVLPWALIALFLLFLIGLDKRVPAIPGISGVFLRLQRKALGMKKSSLAVILGLFTPFLPCAPLYLVFGVALFTGSPLAGGGMLAAFAIGTMAPIWLLQSGWMRLQARFSPSVLRRAQQVLAFVAMSIILWRVMAVGDVTPGEMPVPDCCPLSGPE